MLDNNSVISLAAGAQLVVLARSGDRALIVPNCLQCRLSRPVRQQDGSVTSSDTVTKLCTLLLTVNVITVSISVY